MAAVSKAEIRTLREAFEAAREELEVALELDEWPDELCAALDQADELLDTLAAGGHADAGDAEALRAALAVAEHELEVVLDLREWPDELVEALGSTETLLRTLAPPPPLAPINETTMLAPRPADSIGPSQSL